jgi:hypothetical protein
MTDRAPDDETLRNGDLDPRLLMDAGLMAELIVDIRRLAQGVQTFADELVRTNNRVDELRSLRRRNGTLAIALTVSVLVALLGTWAFMGRLTAVSDAIVECTSPSRGDTVHECYEDSRTRSRENVENLDRAAVDAAICAAVSFGDPNRAQVVEECYEARKADRTADTVDP